jgi:hypothetical protein
MVLSLLFIVCCWSWPLTPAPLDEPMCCVNTTLLFALAKVSLDDFEVVSCDCSFLHTLMNRTYGFTIGMESQLTAKRLLDGAKLSIKFFDDVVTSRLQAWQVETTTAVEGVVVCTYNVWHFTSPYRSRLAEIARLLREQNCDVVLLQEVSNISLGALSFTILFVCFCIGSYEVGVRRGDVSD